MSDKKCPQCGLWNTESTAKCNCGYDFPKMVSESYSPRPILSSLENPIPQKSNSNKSLLHKDNRIILVTMVITTLVGIFYLLQFASFAESLIAGLILGSGVGIIIGSMIKAITILILRIIGK